jgi:hypothetical protein
MPALSFAAGLRRFFSAPVPAARTCVLHSRHSPRHLSTEFHHIVPVAWQLFWLSPAPPFPGKDPSGRGLLWDKRGLILCPTGHRNVHIWITRLMHGCKTEDPTDAIAGVRKVFGKVAASGLEFDTAVLALLRFKEAGGSLQVLVTGGEWGMS